MLFSLCKFSLADLIYFYTWWSLMEMKPMSHASPVLWVVYQWIHLLTAPHWIFHRHVKFNTFSSPCLLAHYSPSSSACPLNWLPLLISPLFGNTTINIVRGLWGQLHCPCSLNIMCNCLSELPILPPKYFFNSFLYLDIPQTALIQNIQNLIHYFPLQTCSSPCVLIGCCPHPLSC